MVNGHMLESLENKCLLLYVNFVVTGQIQVLTGFKKVIIF